MNNQKPLSYEEFKAIYSKVPRLCVEVVIQTSEDVLLTFRQEQAYRGQWHLPGETVYFREKLTDTVKRVAQEELGVDVTVEKQLGYIEYPSELAERGFGYSVSIAFLCSTDTTRITLNEQASQFQFFKTIPANTIVEQKAFLHDILGLEVEAGEE